jgi:hypothetical protein
MVFKPDAVALRRAAAMSALGPQSPLKRQARDDDPTVYGTK